MRKIAVILISLIISFIIMTAGYGLWTEKLSIEGNLILTEDPEVIEALKNTLSSEQNQLEFQNQRLSERLTELQILHEQALLEIQQKQAAEEAKVAEASKVKDTDSIGESEEPEEIENTIPAEEQEDKKEETVVEENITSESITIEDGINKGEAAIEETITEGITTEENSNESYRQEALIEDDSINTSTDSASDNTTNEDSDNISEQATGTEKDTLDNNNN